MSYRYFELGKNADPEREESLQFKNAFTVHPVSDPNLMYRLHKRFSQIELELTYLQIQQLQVRWARSALQPHSSLQKMDLFVLSTTPTFFFWSQGRIYRLTQYLNTT